MWQGRHTLRSISDPVYPPPPEYAEETHRSHTFGVLISQTAERPQVKKYVRGWDLGLAQKKITLFPSFP